MNDAVEQSLAKTIQELKQFILRDWRLPDPESAFAYYLCLKASQLASAVTFPAITWPSEEMLRHPQSLAAFGFLVSADPTYEESLKPNWLEGFERIVKRDPFPLDRQSFAFRPLEVLGVSCGAATLLKLDDESRQSLAATVNRCGTEGNSDTWSQLIYAVARQTLEHTTVLPNFRAGDCNLDECALLKCIDECGLVEGVDDELLLSAEERLLVGHSLRVAPTESVGKASLHYVALTAAVSRRIKSRLAETISVSADTSDALDLVVHLCTRFPLFARQLQVRRKDVPGSDPKERLPRSTIDMVDEYDVQDSLHAILKLFFDDVRPEEWTPSYAGKHTRMDFLLKKEEIVIETKFFGLRLTRNDLIDQLIVDKEHYRQHEDCQKLVCLVYDPDLRCQNPIALERDLSESDDDFQVVTIICPKGL